MTMLSDELTRDPRVAPRLPGLNWRSRSPWLRALVYVALFCLAVLYIYPFLIQIGTSFKTTSDAVSHATNPVPHSWTTSGFSALSGHGFGTWFKNSAILAVSVTAVTDVSEEATRICAFRSVACLSDTELTVHAAVPSSLPQPLVKVGFWLVGLAVSATDTSEAVPFSVETSTTYAASLPRSTLVAERCTATHSSA